MPSAHSSPDGQRGLNVGRREFIQWPLLFSLSICVPLCFETWGSLRFWSPAMKPSFLAVSAGHLQGNPALPTLTALSCLCCLQSSSAQPLGLAPDLPQGGFLGHPTGSREENLGGKEEWVNFPSLRSFLTTGFFTKKREGRKIGQETSKTTQSLTETETKWVFSSRRQRDAINESSTQMCTVPHSKKCCLPPRELQCCF